MDRLRIVESTVVSAKVLSDATAKKDGAPSEELPDGVIMRVEAVLGQVDVVNRNGRLYPRNTEAAAIKAASPMIKGREMFVMSDHPQFSFFGGGDPPNGSVGKVAGIQVSAEIPDDGDDIVGTFDLVDTEAGRDAAAIIRAGGRIGISQRGYGSVVEDEYTDSKGRRVVAGIVQAGYELSGFDIVIGPAADARVQGWRESEERDAAGEPASVAPVDLTVEALRERHPALVESIEASVRASMETEIASKVAEAKARGEASAQERVASLEEDSRTLAALREASKGEELAKVVERAHLSASRMSEAKAAAGHNLVAFSRVVMEAFGDDGRPVEPFDVSVAAQKELRDVATSTSPSPSGKGAVGDDGSGRGDEEADRRRLEHVNRIRASAGLPRLETFPSEG